MAKDNLFLGMARGSVGDVVFSRLDGVQVARSRNRSPRNPRTPLQLLQRVVMATVGKAYTFFSPLADHSYEGETGLQGSQRAFVVENVDLLRNQLAELIAYPLDSRMENSDLLNYSFVGDVGPVYNPYVISKGSLPPSKTLIVSSSPDTICRLLLETNLEAVPSPLVSLTYRQACDALGLQPGDQITSVAAYIDPYGFMDTFVSLQFARIIMMPAGGDLDIPFLAGAGGLNAPNERNTGVFEEGQPTIVKDDTTEKVCLALEMPVESGLLPVAGCIIISRQDSSGIWLRSTESLQKLPDAVDRLDDHQFGNAYISHKRYTASSLYLNQAEGG